MSDHCRDEELLLFADDELPRLRLARVRKHLAICPVCSARLESIQSAMADSVKLLQRGPERAAVSVMDASGPRALLKARLSELAGAPARSWAAHVSYTRGTAYAVVLVLLVLAGVAMLRVPMVHRYDSAARPLPDPGYTPGATRNVALAELCSAQSDEVVSSVPDPLKRKVLREYGIREAAASEFEVDYLITPGLGGTDDVRNLWPQPHSNTTWNSYAKDQLEDRLHRMVCHGEISLREAQRAIAGNWIAAYKKYFQTERPLLNPSQAQSCWEAYPLIALRRKQLG